MKPSVRRKKPASKSKKSSAPWEIVNLTAEEGAELIVRDARLARVLHDWDPSAVGWHVLDALKTGAIPYIAVALDALLETGRREPLPVDAALSEALSSAGSERLRALSASAEVGARLQLRQLGTVLAKRLNQPVVVVSDGVEYAMRLRQVTHQSGFFGGRLVLVGSVLQWSGGALVEMRKQIFLADRGPTTFEELGIIANPSAEKLASLAQRGERILALSRSRAYVHLTGDIAQREWATWEKIPATGRAVVDFDGARLFASDVAVHDLMDGEGEIGDAVERAPMALVYPYVVVFSMATKRWGRASVDQLSDIDFRLAAFDHLVMDDEDKRLVLGLVRSADLDPSVAADFVANKGGGCVLLLHGPPGTGKCLGRGTEVLRYDGHRVPVEQVREGDLLMGPDSTPRRVMSTAGGVGQLCRIVPVKGAPWVCNDVHVLTLVHSLTGEVLDIALDKYLALSATQKHYLKLFQPQAVDFPERSAALPLTPYFLGIWLGDGTKFLRTYADGTAQLNSVQISKPDAEIAQACSEEAALFGLKMRVQADEGKCPSYHLTTGNVGGGPNPLLDALRALMADGVCIPPSYLFGSRDVRAAVLAGLLDTDGSLSDSGYEVTQKSVRLADDIAVLARSLGFRVTSRVKVVNDRAYQRLFISGDASWLPLRIARKVASSRRQKKNVLRTGFSVEAIGDGEYFGFTLDGDGRFLLGDFTVTHNTLTAEAVSEVLRRPLYAIAAGELGTTPKQLEESLERILRMAERWNAVILLDEADVFLERRQRGDIHRNAMVGVFLRLMEYYRGVLILTTNRVSDIDVAFYSRVSLPLFYKEFDAGSRLLVTRNLVSVMGVSLSDADVEKIAAAPVNGRQIKAALRQALSLAREGAREVRVEDVLLVLGRMEKFRASVLGANAAAGAAGTEDVGAEPEAGQNGRLSSVAAFRAGMDGAFGAEVDFD